MAGPGRRSQLRMFFLSRAANLLLLAQSRRSVVSPWRPCIGSVTALVLRGRYEVKERWPELRHCDTAAADPATARQGAGRAVGGGGLAPPQDGPAGAFVTLLSGTCFQACQWFLSGIFHCPWVPGAAAWGTTLRGPGGAGRGQHRGRQPGSRCPAASPRGGPDGPCGTAAPSTSGGVPPGLRLSLHQEKTRRATFPAEWDTVTTVLGPYKRP